MKHVSVILALAGSAGLAMGQDLLQIDIDALSAQASGPFSDTFTGDLLVFGSLANPDIDGDASILDVIIDGNSQNTGGAATDEFSFEMSIFFDGGNVVSGELFVSHDANGSENTYSTALVPTDESAILDAGTFFIISALTTSGNWTDSNGTFLGVNVAPWGQNVDGFFAQINFQPDSNFTDTDTDVDVFMFVPAPGTALGLVVGLGLMGRRRR